MDPLIVFDCEKAVPNRYALAIAAAERARALIRGGELYLRKRRRATPVELALREIAGSDTSTRIKPTVGLHEHGVRPSRRKSASRSQEAIFATVPALHPGGSPLTMP
jgi:DNA-directed RNA polymerase subunit omega